MAMFNSYVKLPEGNSSLFVDEMLEKANEVTKNNFWGPLREALHDAPEA